MDVHILPKENVNVNTEQNTRCLGAAGDLKLPNLFYVKFRPCSFFWPGNQDARQIRRIRVKRETRSISCSTTAIDCGYSIKRPGLTSPADDNSLSSGSSGSKRTCHSSLRPSDTNASSGGGNSPCNALHPMDVHEIAWTQKSISFSLRFANFFPKAPCRLCSLDSLVTICNNTASEKKTIKNL